MSMLSINVENRLKANRYFKGELIWAYEPTKQKKAQRFKTRKLNPKVRYKRRRFSSPVETSSRAHRHFHFCFFAYVVWFTSGSASLRFSLLFVLILTIHLILFKNGKWHTGFYWLILSGLLKLLVFFPSPGLRRRAFADRLIWEESDFTICDFQRRNENGV